MYTGVRFLSEFVSIRYSTETPDSVVGVVIAHTVHTEKFRVHTYIRWWRVTHLLDLAVFTKFQVNIWETAIFALFGPNKLYGLVIISYICIELIILNALISKLCHSEQYSWRYSIKTIFQTRPPCSVWPWVWWAHKWWRWAPPHKNPVALWR